MAVYCPQCGAPVNAVDGKCEYCGAVVPNVAPVQPQAQAQPQPQVVYVQQPVYSERSNWPIKSKVIAGVLALLLGGIGVHKFYLGKTGMGVLYLLFSWTLIPGFVSFIEGIILLCSSDENFEIKYKCRTK